MEPNISRALLQFQQRAPIASSSGRSDPSSGAGTSAAPSMNGPADIDGIEASLDGAPSGGGSRGSSSWSGGSNSDQQGKGASNQGNSSSNSDVCSGGEVTAAALLCCANAVRQAPSSFKFSCSLSGLQAAPALHEDSRLNAVAKKQADFMATSGGPLSGKGANGSSIDQRMAAEGFANSKKMAEAVASSAQGVSDVMSMWMCAQDQKDNLMVCATGPTCRAAPGWCRAMHAQSISKASAGG